MLVPGSAEFLNMRLSQLEEHPVYAKFFEQASKGPLSKATPMVDVYKRQALGIFLQGEGSQKSPVPN